MALMGSVTMSISSLNTNFKELELIIAGNCVIFPDSLIGTTMKDGGKRERPLFRSLAISLQNFNHHYYFQTKQSFV